MTKKKVIVLALIAIVLLLAVMYLWGPSSVPQAKSLSLRCRTQISVTSRMRLTVTPMRLGWCCSFLRRDQLVCGGPPQFSSSWLATRSGKSVCWWFGSRS